MANKNLNAAKVAKKDEFYTQLSDIERELQHYWPHFRGKVCSAIVMILTRVISSNILRFGSINSD